MYEINFCEVDFIVLKLTKVYTKKSQTIVVLYKMKVSDNEQNKS